MRALAWRVCPAGSAVIGCYRGCCLGAVPDKLLLCVCCGVVFRKGWLDGVKLLLAASVDVDLANKRGLSALGEAVAGGHVEAADALLAAGADPDWRSAG